MSLLDPAERRRTGIRNQAELLAAAAPEPHTLLDASWRDFIFAEVWSRPQLDRRSRYLISMSGSARSQDTQALDGYVRGALSGGELSLAELREAALHVAVYSGWSVGGCLDAAITRVAAAMGLPPAPIPPIRAEPWDPQARIADGAAGFKNVMVFGGPPPATAYFEAGILNFVFGEMWMRTGLDQRSRRWLTLVGVSDSAASIPIRSHVHAAMASGNTNRAEMNEFVLQYAIHAGWPKASVVQGAVLEQAARVEKGLPFEA
ncbi:MAG: Gamma-carboxymuconolactone decarboxylase [Hydrocarboniphaga sp.]|uniref:carboxymuconolactone decarboxylase family protein n=1 Tax=Hydrocarboniphaga sp. TaxID=2033016 RepID=UPI00261FBE4B|nr:carboxymuconolactone decarboxylase family protein [Hydrocarboniphaga sp.]MDB5968665.1 Gamma-carboxymuconolactone decarboxylase [Hydrocarboniphaga sp.]